MQLDQTILTSVRFYPTISQTREVVLNHLFFTIGNGYEWVDGELVGDDHEFVGVDPVEHQVEWARKFARDQSIKDVDDYVMRRLAQVLPIIETAEERVATRWYPHEFEYPFEEETFPYNSSFIYPICEYSRVHTVPNDVQDDWLLGAVEAINMVAHLAPMEVMRDVWSHDAEESARQLERNLSEAKKAKANLIERFGRLDELGAEWLD
jgi:hypothetical protein